MRNVGQLIFTGISGLSLTDDEKIFIEQEEIGGVLLFSHNYESPAQLAELVNSIQSLRQEYPLFIAVDQEGGRVQRFKEQFTVFPSAKSISSLDSPKTIFEAYAIIAQELAACGLNVNFAPCADIVTSSKNKVIGDRSFGDNPKDVERSISGAIRGLQTNNVMACIKHFPGHGLSWVDSHDELPKVNKSLEELKDWDLIPFVKGVKSRVEFLMVAHMVVDAFDKELPCTLSSDCYKYIREELKYKKIIITDDMQMGAIEKNYGLEDAAVMAINAGADMLEYRDMNKAKAALEALKANVSKDILEDRVSRVMTTKKEKLKTYQPVFIPNLPKVFGRKSSGIFCEDLVSKISNLNS